MTQSVRMQRRAVRAAQNRKQWIGTIILALLIAAALVAINQDRLFPDPPIISEANPNMITTNSGLQYEDLVIGDGQEAQAGDLVSVHYTGWLTDGTKFDSSKDRNQPFEFSLGAGMVIRGWDEGVAGMNIGGQRKLTIPANLGYGSRGAGGVIPPNANLVFEVELLGIK
jgi:FKBP-type peptidyl-prolyl cis-trans isomerase FkpA